MTPRFPLCHVPQAVKSMSEEMKVCGGSEKDERKGGGSVTQGGRKRNLIG